MALLVVALASLLYNIAISFGYGRKFADDDVSRPVVIMGGIFIVIGGMALEAGDIEKFWDLLKWFAVPGIWMFIRASLLHVLEKEEKEEAAEQQHLEIESNRVGGG